MKEMKRDEARRGYALIRALGVTALALLMLVSIASAVSAGDLAGVSVAPVTLTVSPSSGQQGTTFTFSGDGYTPDRAIEFHVRKPDNTEFPTATLTVSSSGVLSYNYQSTTASVVGTYTIWAVDKDTGKQSENVQETITAASIAPVADRSLVQVDGSTDVYFIENGSKRHFTSPEALLWNGHNFDDVITVTSETLQKYNNGKDISISQAIIDKYNALGGATTFGASKGEGELTGESDKDGNYCSYVNFEKGAIDCFVNGPNAGKAYAIVDQFYTKWTSMGYGSSVLGYPIGDMSEKRTSIQNTPYKYQLFTNGKQLGALEWNLNDNKVYEVHGAIFAKWAEIGFASSVIGLPTGDEQDIPNSKYGTVGRYGTFENGHIHWNKATGVSYVTYGALNECYNNIQGTQSDLGFPTMSQVSTTDGHDYCEFEKGYIAWNSNKYEPNYGPTIDQKIDAKLKEQANFPQYLLDEKYIGKTAVLSMQLSDFITHTDLTGQYDKLYNDGIKYSGIRNGYLYNAKQSLKNNDITGAEKFLERAEKMQTCTYNSFQAANDVFIGSTESAEILAQGVRTECELICDIGFGYAPYSSLSILGQSVKYKDAMFVTFACVDICKEWKINGFGEGAKQGAIIVLTNYITSGIKYDALGGKTLEHAVVDESIDISQPAVRKQINVEIVDKLMTPEVQKQLFEDGFHGTAIGAADAAAMYFTEDELNKVINNFVETTSHMNQ